MFIHVTCVKGSIRKNSNVVISHTHLDLADTMFEPVAMCLMLKFKYCYFDNSMCDSVQLLANV